MSKSTTKQRLRVQKACDICKRRKVKCDGLSPCSNCIRHNVDCTYDYRTFASRKKPRFITNVLSSSRESSVASSIPLSSNGKSVFIEDQTAKLLLELSSNREHSSNSSLYVNDEKQLSSIRRDYIIHGPEIDNQKSPWFTFSRDKYRFHRRYQNVLPYYLGRSLLSQLPPDSIKSFNLEVPRIQNYGWNLSGGHYIKASTFSDSNDSNNNGDLFFNFDNSMHLSIVNKLLNFFFNEINKSLSILDYSTFWKQYNNGFLQQGKQNNNSTKLFTSILYLVLAIALRFKDGELQAPNVEEPFFSEEELLFLNKTHDKEGKLFNYSYSIVSKLTFEWESFELLQSWLLITFYLRTCHRQIACWSALGKAVTMCKGMSLHLNQLPEIHSENDRIKAWNCFWAVFIMDKLISFQIGRAYLLDLPIDTMIRPDNATKTKDISWFSSETIHLYELSLLILCFQKQNAQELSPTESLEFRQSLDLWISKQNFDNWSSLYQVQPFLTYLDIKLTFEAKTLLALLEPPTDLTSKSLHFNVDFNSLISASCHSINLLELIVKNKQFFIPWWLNLSQLFSVSLISLTLLQAGIKTNSTKDLLARSMNLWNSLANEKPKNPPSMLAQCVWCIKMLNHIACLRLLQATSILNELVGINETTDNSVNKNNFEQFAKVGEDEEPDQENDSNMPFQILQDSLSTPTDDLLEEDLFGNLQWFDQAFL
ncbi:hypothetical protein KAFR_0A02130 [Kazachstania africana CBS 2517]|uniref:Zn(2)-C6 fungal-type domain-containing protein n=1 Tax=Kazachstania africana (strain ATCC 22294 / BCRC 22015 / CBS 2517 / CECT 1963 / NBRC 1671 / NRRL Y-8276) TaxID=1071382 RepID=H2AMQ1_KAZAF|nr:hypothetical protein KAFR_0A02130 [Kazachstania africana CBS 2517]CCF55651.1 hypothetical protein KAFR_0A02130 [Kazachstania africana CBS 2517]